MPLLKAEEKIGIGLSRDGTQITLHVFIREICAVIEHLTNDARKALQAYIIEAILDANTKINVNPILLHF